MKAFVVALCCLLPVLRAQEKPAPFPMPSGDEGYVALSAVQKPFSDEEKEALHALVENRLQQLEKMIPDVRLATKGQLRLLHAWEEAYRFAPGREEEWFTAILADEDEGRGRSEFAVDYRYDLALRWSMGQGDEWSGRLLVHRFRSSVEGKWIEERMGEAYKIQLLYDVWQKATKPEVAGRVYQAFQRAFPDVMAEGMSRKEQMDAALLWYHEHFSRKRDWDYVPVNGSRSGDARPLFRWKVDWKSIKDEYGWPVVMSPDEEYAVMYHCNFSGAVSWELYVFRRSAPEQYEHIAVYRVCTRYANTMGRDEEDVGSSLVFAEDGLEFLLKDEKGVHRHRFPYASETGSWHYRSEKEQ